jgi:thiamine kinase-like enzyme
MRTPPSDLDEVHLVSALADQWAFSTAELRYAPVGFGSHHWTATHADGARRFVTVDDLAQQGPGDADHRHDQLSRALGTAYALREAGLDFVAAPLRARDSAVLQRIGPRYAVSVFPYVDGRAFPDSDRQTARDRSAVVDALARLHEATPVTQEIAGVDDLALADRQHLDQALTKLEVPWSTGPYAESTRQALAAAKADLRVLLSAYDRLVDVARTNDDAWVVTHGEPKADNMLATGSGPVLVDWDTALVAPAARDLWMLDSETGEDIAAYSERAGRHVSRDELLLYRLRWTLTDVTSYVRWFMATHERTADTEIGWNALSLTLQSIAMGRSSGSLPPTTS